jgi:protein-S-isoprenylcysteine O-methyltransferase Ste14
MHAGVFRYIDWIWVAVGAVWLIAALASKKTTRREAAPSRLLHIAIMAAAFLLLFPSLLASKLPVGPLARRFVPDSPAIAWTGLALTVAGCAFAIWARALLGGNWSDMVTVKQDHQLIHRGPYAMVRHPIYAGFLLGFAGTAGARRMARYRRAGAGIHRRAHEIAPGGSLYDHSIQRGVYRVPA